MNTVFDQPVAIFVGLGFSRQVETVAEANQVLSEWPMHSQGRDYELALNACRCALAGKVDLDTARAVFEIFARGRGNPGVGSIAA